MHAQYHACQRLDALQTALSKPRQICHAPARFGNIKRGICSRCARNMSGYILCMAKRTDPSDADHIIEADDLQMIVKDKREGWRANGAAARRRQRRYSELLTRQLLRNGSNVVEDPD